MSTTAQEVMTTDAEQETLEFVRQHPDPCVLAGEVAEEFDITPQAANRRLKNLVGKNKLKRKRAGSSAVVYWCPDQS